MKAAIMCHGDNWTESLPIVLLGIRSCFKDDLQTSSAELVYGETLRLPGEFFDPISNTTNDITDFTARLRNVVQNLRPVPTSRHGQKKTFIFKDLATATHVFIREDAVRGALQSAYTGPHAVLQKNEKYYTILVKNKPLTVSIDRLKPAFLLEENTHAESAKENKSPEKESNKDESKQNKSKESKENKNKESKDDDVKYTRSGRRVRFPDHYRP